MVLAGAIIGVVAWPMWGLAVGAAGRLFWHALRCHCSETSNVTEFESRLILARVGLLSRRRHGFGVNGFRQGDGNYAQNQNHSCREECCARAQPTHPMRHRT